MIQISFILLATAGLLFFLLKKRRFDFFSLAFISGCVYFMPGFFGDVLYPYATIKTEAVGEKVSIIPGAYLIMMLVMGGILISAIFFDSLSDQPLRRIKFQGDKRATAIYLLISIASLALVLLTNGKSLFIADKNTMMESLNRWIILFELSSLLLFITAVQEKSRIMIFIGGVFLIFDMYIGFRSTTSIAIMATFLMLFHSAGRQSVMAQNYRYFMAGIVGALLLFVSKGIQFAIKSDQWDLVVDRLSNPDFYLFWITNSEPFITQAILNKVVAVDYRTGYEHILSALNQFILFAPELGAENISFNDFFQTALFPNITTWGMANNIWAQMYSAGSWLGVLIFIIIFCLILGLLSRALLVLEGAGAVVLVTMGCYWAFYIHRNDISYQLLLEKRVLIFGLGVLILADLLSWRPQNPQGTPDAKS